MGSADGWTIRGLEGGAGKEKEAVLYASRERERERERERAVIYSNNDVRLSQGRSRLIAYVVVANGTEKGRILLFDIRLAEPKIGHISGTQLYMMTEHKEGYNSRYCNNGLGCALYSASIGERKLYRTSL